ncbi:aspartyl protease family protein [Pseudofulvibacter geojedonensis]
MFCCSKATAQSNFDFPVEKKKAKIHFELINNLMIVPVEVNGAQLSFLLDTGVRETVLFNVKKVDSITLLNTRLLKIKGINDEEIQALKSEGNTLKVGGLVCDNHMVYVALNQNEHLSSYLGKEIHGILGYHFFKNFVVEVLYQSQLIRVFPEETYKRRWNSFEKVSLDIIKGKPFVNAKVNNRKVNLLLDTGMSDSLWMFDVDVNSLQNFGYYEDFLGMTISGEITGKRSKIEMLDFVGQVFKDVKIAYPYKEQLPPELLEQKNRAGSIGSELLKRFTIVLDYNNEKMYLKPNKWIDEPFYYNKTGIILRQDGEAVEANKNNPLLKSLEQNNFISYVDLSYLLSPEFVIDHVRKNSPADLVGLQKDDKLIEVNGTKTFRYKLKAINSLFFDEENKRLELKVERKGKKLIKIIYLKSPLIKNALVN